MKKAFIVVFHDSSAIIRESNKDKDKSKDKGKKEKQPAKPYESETNICELCVGFVC